VKQVNPYSGLNSPVERTILVHDTYRHDGKRLIMHVEVLTGFLQRQSATGKKALTLSVGSWQGRTRAKSVRRLQPSHLTLFPRRNRERQVVRLANMERCPPMKTNSASRFAVVKLLRNPVSQQLKLGLRLTIALVAGLVWVPRSANCAQMTIEIRATVSLVDDADNLLNNTVRPGDIIAGVYSYNSFAVDSNPLPEVGDYYYSTAPNGIRLNVNGLTFATDPANVNFLLEVVNNYEGAIITS
jgi:hypothetical protein